jgi:uncharacterized protein (DUF488 family)
MDADGRPAIWTVGHSTRTLGEFLEVLAGPKIGLVADVRRFPGSKRHPHFNAGALAASLAGTGIDYAHYPDLGGRRGRRAPGSPNTGWRVEAFNAFADHMETPEFQAALADLAARALATRTAVMCSEAVPWRCHRRLIADALTAGGWAVFDLMAPGKVEPHTFTPFARVEGTRVTYPAEPLFPGETTPIA